MSEHPPLPSPPRRSPRLNSGLKSRADESSLVADFVKFCGSSSLSLHLMKKWLAVIPRNALDYSPSLHHLCLNKKVTLGVVKSLIDFYPDAVHDCRTEFCPSDDSEAYPLHLACYNECCPGSVIQYLITRSRFPLNAACTLFDDGAERGSLNDLACAGLPLHYYLGRKANIDLDTVNTILKMSHPESLRLDIENGVIHTPVHVIVQNPNIDGLQTILQHLVEADPSTLQLMNVYDKTPLHEACANPFMTPKIIRLLVDLCPQAARSGDDLPIHNLCSNRELEESASLEILNILLESFHDSVLRFGEDCYLPIHVAATYKSLAFCKLLVQACEESVRIGDQCENRLPLLHACGLGNLHTAAALYDMYPEGIHRRSVDGFLPIHGASFGCTHETNSIDTIKFLLMHDPDGASRAVSSPNGVSRHEGCLPLHLACDAAYGFGVAKYLFDVYPEAIYTRDQRGRLPIDIVTKTPIHRERLNTVVYVQTQWNYARQARDKNFLATPDRDGWLPLHRALFNNASLGSIKLYIQGNPSSVRTTTPGGMLPLHIASQASSVAVVNFLVELDPEALTTCSAKKNSPLHHACEAGNYEVVQYLIEKHVSSISERNDDDKLPVHLLCDRVASRITLEGGTSPRYLESLWRLLVASPESVANW